MTELDIRAFYFLLYKCKRCRMYPVICHFFRGHSIGSILTRIDGYEWLNKAWQTLEPDTECRQNPWEYYGKLEVVTKQEEPVGISSDTDLFNMECSSDESNDTEDDDDDDDCDELVDVSIMANIVDYDSDVILIE